MIDQGYINHVVLVLDASVSMRHLREEVVAVADNLISHLAQRSKELDQETRITVYKFGDAVNCLVYDKDVLRLPSMKTLYNISGNTALLDATYKAIEDLKKTATLYGDHAFLVYVLTDGEENSSRTTTASKLQDTLVRLPDNWTLAAMVPNQLGAFEAKKFGFPANNISVWDVSKKGISEAGEVIRRATDNFMQARSQGFRGTKTLFDISLDNVSLKNLTRLSPLKYSIWAMPPNETMYIKDFVEKNGRTYQIGHAYYELVKRETIQAQKDIAIQAKDSGDVYVGTEARGMLGLPNENVMVSPTDHPLYRIFVQSTSVNRKLMFEQKVLYIHG